MTYRHIPPVDSAPLCPGMKNQYVQPMYWTHWNKVMRVAEDTWVMIDHQYLTGTVGTPEQIAEGLLGLPIIETRPPVRSFYPRPEPGKRIAPRKRLIKPRAVSSEEVDNLLKDLGL